MARKDHGDEIEELPDVSYIKNEDVQHEHTDVPIKPIAQFMVALFVAAVVIHVGIYFMFDFLEGRAKRAEPPPGPFASERSNVPPEPRLQLIPSHEIHPLDEWKLFKAGEEQALSNYGWVDQKSGVVRIPIEEAKKLLLQQGLPSRDQGAAQRQGGGQPAPSGIDEGYPSDQSSGRVIERRKH